MTDTVLNDGSINKEQDRHGVCLQLRGVGWREMLRKLLHPFDKCDHYYDGKKQTNRGNQDRKIQGTTSR